MTVDERKRTLRGKLRCFFPDASFSVDIFPFGSKSVLTWKECWVRWLQVAAAPSARDSEAAPGTRPLESLDRKRADLRDEVMVALAWEKRQGMERLNTGNWCRRGAKGEILIGR